MNYGFRVNGSVRRNERLELSAAVHPGISITF